jgi:hypothetical protein
LRRSFKKIRGNSWLGILFRQAFREKKAGVLWRRRLELKVRICAVKPETATAANEFDVIMTWRKNNL